MVLLNVSTKIKMKVQVITIGDEILIGQIVDTNSAWMGAQLNDAGFDIENITTVGDEEQAIKEALDRAFSQSDIVLMTGGLGPTKDDITKKTLADYFGVGMVFSESTFNRIQRMFEKWGRSTTEAHRIQCYMPANATLLFNQMGTAPGMWFEHNGKVAVSMPGVPYEMKYLMTEEVIPKLATQFTPRPVIHRTIQTIGEGETRIATRIESVTDNLPDSIKVAFLPGLGKVRVRLTTTGDNQKELQQLLDEKVKEIAALIPEFVFGYGDDKLEEVVGKLLMEKGKFLTIAESCTGGYVSHRITAVPGSSAYFTGSIVPYSNAIKVNQLKVKPDTLKEYGAVSEATVVEMVKGLLDLMQSDIAIAISGIAGPGGGSEEKPVGTIWLAIGDKDRVITRKLNLGKKRLQNIEYTGNQALNMVRQFLLEG